MSDTVSNRKSESMDKKKDFYCKFIPINNSDLRKH